VSLPLITTKVPPPAHPATLAGRPHPYKSVPDPEELARRFLTEASAATAGVAAALGPRPPGDDRDLPQPQPGARDQGVHG